MTDQRPTLWSWIKLIPWIIYWRFIWKPKEEEGAKEDGKKES
jgi:hypothetical protein